MRQVMPQQMWLNIHQVIRRANRFSVRILVLLIQLVVRAICRPTYLNFQNALGDPRKAQRKLLAELVTASSKTNYGKSLGLTGHENETQFRNLVPLCDFNDGVLDSWIERQLAAPDEPMLAPGGAKSFEKTSGSSSAQKIIPYNSDLLSSFDRYFRIWLYDLLRAGPKLETMRLFMSISPAFQRPEDLEKRIGVADDSEYVSPVLRFFLKLFLAVPLNLRFTKDSSIFLDKLCAHLVLDRDLEVLSIWHPSFFLVIWNHLVDSRKRIADLINQILTGDITHRQATIALLRSSSSLQPVDLWPKLKLISAWDAANSRLPAQQLQRLFPNVFFQGKGLLATEAPMTLPLIGQGVLPFVTDVLFEFINDAGKFFWVDEVEVGHEYTLVISQKGGLLRYRIGDRVRVLTSSVTPSLEFIGRDHDSSDLVGEKMTARYLASHESRFTKTSGCTYYLFLPTASENRAGYVALIETESASDSILNDHLSGWWEERLMQSHHYAYARKMGQLDGVQVIQVPKLQQLLLQFYVQTKGMKAGDVKLRTLLHNPDESQQILQNLGITLKENAV